MAPMYNILKVRGVIDSAIGSFLTYPWIILGAAFVLIFLVVYGRFVLQLPPRTRTLMIVGGALFVLGAMGLELIDSYFASVYGHGNAFSSLSVIFEETFEMLGVVVFIYGLLDYIALYAAEIQIRIQQVVVSNDDFGGVGRE